MLMISAKGVEKRCPENPTQISPQPRPTPVEARLEPYSKKFRHHTGRSPVDLLFSLLPLAIPVEARLVPRQKAYLLTVPNLVSIQSVCKYTQLDEGKYDLGHICPTD